MLLGFEAGRVTGRPSTGSRFARLYGIRSGVEPVPVLARVMESRAPRHHQFRTRPSCQAIGSTPLWARGGGAPGRRPPVSTHRCFASTDPGASL